jgi:hypothetical protein
VQEEGELALAQGRGRVGDGRVLLLGRGEVAAQQLRIEPQQAPARHVERPPVGAEVREVAGAALVVDRLLAARRRVLAVAEVVVAGQEAHRQAKAIVQGARRGEVALLRCTVERDVAGVEHKVWPVGAQRFADAPEIVDEERLVVAEMGVGDLGDAEGHA